MSLTQHLTLEEVAGGFTNWRRIKKPGDHIPSELWQQAKKLLSRLGLTWSDNYPKCKIVIFEFFLKIW